MAGDLIDRRGFLFGRHGVEAYPHTLLRAIAVIDGACLSQRGIVCRVCEEQCDARAVRIRLAVGGGTAPTVEPALCTGCGACVAPCPAEAIAIRPSDYRQKGY